MVWLQNPRIGGHYAIQLQDYSIKKSYPCAVLYLDNIKVVLVYIVFWSLSFIQKYTVNITLSPQYPSKPRF